MYAGNTALGRGIKGSKYWMQVASNDPKAKKRFDEAVGDTLVWRSPLKSEEYREYSLNDDIIAADWLGIGQKEKYFDWWPQRQPQWDGLAIGEEKILYIVEAKAHLSELESRCLASSGKSKSMIRETMSEIQRKYFPKAEDFERYWLNEYYQLGNRLTFLAKLRENLPPNVKGIKLVLLNFVDDSTYISTPEYDWVKHYEEVWEDMTGSKQCPEDVIVVNYILNGLCENLE